MPTYKLTYLEFQGLAEPARLLFAAGGMKYEDVRLKREQWLELKPRSPTGHLPILEVDGTVIGESRAVWRLIAKEVGMAGKTLLEQARADMIVDSIFGDLTPDLAFFWEEDENKKKELKQKFVEKTLPTLARFEKLASAEGYFVGNSMSWADVYFFHFIDVVNKLIPGEHLKGYASLKRVVDNVSSNPGIAKWLKDRPETPF
ncbi:glutathione S-transferase 1-like isoform X2 [Branchiostoma floridae]|uniref:glutathione transferase n=1 Tax=Branchiostoma floridae TaxID=7739 RepID=A0A9J7MVF6_BRAFL|nr:glutathione S-transferase 1-like isoform X2 [Branchiostoma floridae]